MNAPTPIQQQPWFNHHYKCTDVAEDVDLHVRVSDEQTAIYQFVSTNAEPNDPPIETTLQYGYDADANEDSWFFTVKTGGKYFLSQFDPA